MTRQRRQSEWPETEKELMNESLSPPRSPALPSIAPCKLWLPHSHLATAGGYVMNTLWRNVLHHAWCTRSRWRRDKFSVMGQEIPTPKKRAVQCNGKCNMGLFFLLVFCLFVCLFWHHMWLLFSKYQNDEWKSGKLREELRSMEGFPHLIKFMLETF